MVLTLQIVKALQKKKVQHDNMMTSNKRYSFNFSLRSLLRTDLMFYSLQWSGSFLTFKSHASGVKIYLLSPFFCCQVTFCFY